MTHSKTIPLKDPREARAARWLESLGHRPVKIKEGNRKKPDFHVLAKADDEFFFYLEVKTIEGPGESEGLLFDPLFNRVSNDIRDARKQFENVDPEHNLPRVLLFLAEDFRIHGQTMFDFFSGRIEIEGEILRELKRFRFGRVRDDLREIDLFVMLDRDNTPTFFYNETIPSKALALQEAFDHVGRR